MRTEPTMPLPDGVQSAYPRSLISTIAKSLSDRTNRSKRACLRVAQTNRSRMPTFTCSILVFWVAKVCCTELGEKDLINNRMVYLSVSRGAHDAQIFTSDREKLPEAPRQTEQKLSCWQTKHAPTLARLSRDVSHQSAHTPEIVRVAEQNIDSKQAIGPKEMIYTMAEHNRHGTQLNEAVTSQEAQQFTWKQETGSIQSYQHT